MPFGFCYCFQNNGMWPLRKLLFIYLFIIFGLHNNFCIEMQLLFQLTHKNWLNSRHWPLNPFNRFVSESMPVSDGIKLTLVARDCKNKNFQNKFLFIFKWSKWVKPVIFVPLKFELRMDFDFTTNKWLKLIHDQIRLHSVSQFEILNSHVHWFQFLFYVLLLLNKSGKPFSNWVTQFSNDRFAT